MTRLHDAEIVGLSLPGGTEASDNELILTVRSIDGARRLRFRDTADWALYSFGPQNVILNFYAYDRFTLTAQVLDFFGVPDDWAEQVRGGSCRLYALTASVGLEGLVLARGLVIEEDV